VGVEEYARNVSHSVIFMRYDYSAHSSPDELVLPRVIWERGTVDGVIIAGTNYPNFVQAVQALRIPCVLFGNNLIGRVPIEEIDTIWYDTEAAAREATDYLIGLGHAKISFAGDTNLPWYRRLHRGYAAALDQRGLPRHELNPEVHSSLFDYGMSCASEIANERRRSTAVLAGDDEIALGMLAGFRRLGIRIPDDISLIGCDDIDAIQYVHPALTTIRIPKQRIGKELAVALFNRLAEPGGKPAKRVLPAELVTRESCKRPLK
jgi:DNA-binding LacI/PurR family transcriptional regulator